MSNALDHPWMVFDVESCGLYGEGFAVGWVVVECPPPMRELKLLADGIAVADTFTWPLPEWVRENVMPHLPAPTHARTAALRDEFWSVWMDWKEKGALLAADVAWPVEAAFLFRCYNDDRDGREWNGPYPLVDIASVRLAAGLDPLGEEERRPFETPAHNPLADARQSARLLIEALLR